MFKYYSLNRILVLYVTLGFVFLLVDTTIEHWDIFFKEYMVFIPAVFCLLGVMLGAIAVLKWNEKWIRLLHIFFIVSFLVAGAGFYFHVKEEDDDKPLVASIKQEQEEKSKDKPILAPLAFGGIALFGLLGTSRKRQSETV